jgi:hypothetical protein
VGSPYYNEVQSYFSNYTNHPLVVDLQNIYEDFFSDPDSEMEPEQGGIPILINIMYYSTLQNDEVVMEPAAYHSLNASIKGLCDEVIQHCNDFIVETNFLDFFNNHQELYDKNIEYFKKAVPAGSIIKWLDNQFPVNYHKHLIYISPIIGNEQFSFTLEFSKKGWTGVILPGVEENIYTSVDEGNYSRICFTEMDHNYVDPTTHLVLDEINIAFANLNKWGKVPFYGSPWAVFNEYMTFAAFSLFTYDRYSQEDFENINRTTIDLMLDRGFPKYESFFEKILELYKNRSENETVSDLLTDIIEWAKSQ